MKKLLIDEKRPESSSSKSKGDPRFGYVEKLVRDAFRNVSDEYMEIFLDSDLFQNHALQFLDEPETRSLFVSDDPSAAPERKLLCFTEPKSEHDGTILYFLKMKPVRLTYDQMNELVIFGEAHRYDAVEHLESVTSEVCIPILDRQTRGKTWSDAITPTLMEKTYNFLAQVQVVSGKVKGQTRLPIPPQLSSAVEKEQLTHKQKSLHLAERCIVQWTELIQRVLDEKPEDALNQVDPRNENKPVHPGPLEELDYWNARLRNMDSIFEQLQSEKMRKILLFLDRVKSTYNPNFARLCRTLFKARSEARENCRYLAPLRPWFEKLENVSSSEISNTFHPIMHILLNIWKYSSFYNTPPRLVVILKMICNAVIRGARSFVNIRDLMKSLGNDQEIFAVEKIRQVVRVCGHLKGAYAEYRTKSQEKNPWNMRNDVIFSRLDNFVSRCQDIVCLVETAAQYSEVAHVFVGGTRGRTLTTSLQNIHDDFFRAVRVFEAIEVDVMDVSESSTFDDLYFHFRIVMKELDRRLVCVLEQAFEGCPTVSGRFKLLSSFRPFLSRPGVAEPMKLKGMSLLEEYHKDLQSVHQLFISNRTSGPRCGNNMPPASGGVLWARSLIRRVEAPMRNMRTSNKSMLRQKQSFRVVKLYQNLTSQLKIWQKSRISKWAEDAKISSRQKLKQNLLRKDKNGRVKVNFDFDLLCLLREVKYFRIHGIEIPEAASDIAKNASKYARQIRNLELVSTMYNTMQSTLHPLEVGLLQERLKSLDDILRTAFVSLTWTSSGIDEFVDRALEATRQVHRVSIMLEVNRGKAADLMKRWIEPHNVLVPVCRGSRPLTQNEHEEQYRKAREKQYEFVQSTGETLCEILAESNRAVKISTGLPEWKAYADYFNSLVFEGVHQAVVTALERLNDALRSSNGSSQYVSPTLEVEMDLIGDRVCFKPSVSGIADVVLGWIDSFMHLGELFPRLDSKLPGGSFSKELREDHEVRYLISCITRTLQSTVEECMKFRDVFHSYRYLWETDPNDVFRNFLKEAQRDDKNAESPKLSLFDERMTRIEKEQKKIESLTEETDLGFVRVNAKPVKQALTTCATRWIYVFSNHLHDYVISTLQDLASFMTDADHDLATTVTSSDMNSCMIVMRRVREIYNRMRTTGPSLEPLADAASLLVKHGETFRKEFISVGTEQVPVLKYLKNASTHWGELLNRTFKREANIKSVRDKWMSKIKKDVNEFESRSKTYLKIFRKDSPQRFVGDVSEAILRILDVTKQICAFEKERDELFKLVIIFGVEEEIDGLDEDNIKFAKSVYTMRSELELVSQVWDLVKRQREMFNKWGNLGWNNMDCGAYGDLSLAIENEPIVTFEEMTKELEILAKEVYNIDTRAINTQTWSSYVHLTQRIKDMRINLSLIRDLHHLAIRERHWRDISSLTGSSNIDVTSSRCRLRDILSMGLQIFDKDVSQIINLARAEHSVGSSLDEIERLWDKEKISTKVLSDAEGLCNTNRILQIADDHQMKLQQLLMTGRSVDIFRDRVSRWRKRLNQIETVIRVWITVQNEWVETEHIFKIGSTNEIQALVPHALEVFSRADMEWKSFMKSIVSSSGLVSEICGDKARHEALLRMQRDLETSRRALDDFFRNKREIYPRLFFLSDIQLCDIFSAGQRDVPRIAKHISSIHRGISKVEFDPLSQRRSKDESKLLPPNEILAYVGTAPFYERVPMQKVFKAIGQPEDWLHNFELSVKRTLRTAVVKAYETSTMWNSGEVKREKWLVSTCAQVAILVMRLRFVEDTESKMDAMDSGEEDALQNYLELCRQRLQNMIDLYRGVEDEDKKNEGKEEEKKDEESTTLTLERRGLVGDAIALDLRSRDLVEKLVNRKCQGAQDFMWESQLRMYFQPETFGVTGRVCDFEHSYFYDPLDRLKRLVVTPLTERCFVSIACALQTNSSVSVVGTSSSGKTDTLISLARRFGMSVYTFDCTNTVTCRDMGSAISGLAQLGSWGLFRHLDRLSVDVLSVTASQLRSVFEAIRRNLVPENREEEFQIAPEGRPGVPVARFSFPGHDIKTSRTIQLVPTVNVFVTMNSSLSSCLKLPENLKTMFRPCSIMCPDTNIMCEYLLSANGFQHAKRLASKISFVFKSSSELVSRRSHYNWSVRGVARLVDKICELRDRSQEEKEEESENDLVLRALQTFREASMQDCDMSEFNRLVNDMFGEINNKSHSINKNLREIASKSLKSENLEQDEEFLNKVCSLSELLRAQHSVIVLGPPASGKTEIWRCLARCHGKQSCVVETISPKTMSHEELYGKTCERSGKWKDGAISHVLRSMSCCTNGYDAKQTQKWVVMDGNLDESWMSAMYSATGQDAELRLLESNERVSITNSMKIIFETDTLTHASPAIVSRSGVLYINEGDVGHEPFVTSWCARRGKFGERIRPLFRKYVKAALKLCVDFRNVIPVQSLHVIKTVCAVLDAFSFSSRDLFVPYHMQWKKDTRPSTAQTFEATKAMRLQVESLNDESVEMLFLYALIWGFGSALVDRNDSGNFTTREAFSAAFLERFPDLPTSYSNKKDLFDSFLLPTSCGNSIRIHQWSDFVPTYDAIEHGSAYDETRPFASIVIPTEQSCRTVWLMQLLEHAQRPILVVGSAGSQKTSLAREFMNRLGSRGNVINQTVTMNRNMNASSLQIEMEHNLVRHSGDNYGAPSSKRIHIFVDDVHKPLADQYGVQSSTELLRHFFDYRGWRDRENLGRHKAVSDCGIVATGNPAVSSFLLNARLHHHFSVVAVSVPRTRDLETIYGQILGTYFSAFSASIQNACKSALATSFELFQNVRRTFRPSPACCHYRFGMQEISELMEGLCRANTTTCTTPFKLMRLWFHEACRVFRDRMISEYDSKRMTNLTVETVKKFFGSMEEDKIRAEPLLFKNDTSCTELKSYDTLRDRLTNELGEYNSKYKIMNLVLFDEAIEHVMRIARSMRRLGGNIILVGPEACGKQSLARLAAWTCGDIPFHVASNCKSTFRACLRDLVKFVAVSSLKGKSAVIYVNVENIDNDEILADLESVMTTGYVRDLFEDREYDLILNEIRPAAQAAMVRNTKQDMHEFLIKRVRSNLHVVLSVTSSTQTLRRIIRQYSGIERRCDVNWIRCWNDSSLSFVASTRFPKIAGETLKDRHEREALLQHMASVHETVVQTCKEYEKQEDRYFRVTLKTFVCFVDHYLAMYSKKQDNLRVKIETLSRGIESVSSAEDELEILQTNMSSTSSELKEKMAETTDVLESMGLQRREIKVHENCITSESERCRKLSAEVSSIESKISYDLAQARPVMAKAKSALSNLKKKAIVELKSMGKLPKGVDDVVNTVYTILTGELEPAPWSESKKLMAKVDKFRARLEKITGEELSDAMLHKLHPVLTSKSFASKTIRKRSEAAGYLRDWALNVFSYATAFENMRPLRKRLQEARKEKLKGEERLKQERYTVDQLERKIKDMEKLFVRKTSERLEIDMRLRKAKSRVLAASRLLKSLEKDRLRWSEELSILRENRRSFVGDCALTAAFVCYAGAFTRPYRNRLMILWRKDLISRDFFVRRDIVSPVSFLCNASERKIWISQGYRGTDEKSFENAAIFTNCVRWPFLFDPERRLTKWALKRCGSTAIRLVPTQNDWLDLLANAIERGQTVFMENLSDCPSSELVCVIRRELYRKGRHRYIRFGGREVKYDPKFRLILQTSLQNPKLPNELLGHCNIVYDVETREMLRSALLDEIIRHEDASLQSELATLKSRQDRTQVELLKHREEILSVISSLSSEDIMSEPKHGERVDKLRMSCMEIEEKLEEIESHQKEIEHMCKPYNRIADEGALIFATVLSELHTINPLYQFSMSTYMRLYRRGVREAPGSADVSRSQRLASLLKSIRIFVLSGIARGMNERDRLTLIVIVTFRLCRDGYLNARKTGYTEDVLNLLMETRVALIDVKNPVESWLPNTAWSSLCVVSTEVDALENITDDMKKYETRFKEWYELDRPEIEPLPLQWRELEDSPMLKLVVVKALRPDRYCHALSHFVSKVLSGGTECLENFKGRSCETLLREVVEEVLENTRPRPPVLIVNAGLENVESIVENLARVSNHDGGFKRLACSQALGDALLEEIRDSWKNGHWIVLSNVNLMSSNWGERLNRLFKEISAIESTMKTAKSSSGSSNTTTTTAATSAAKKKKKKNKKRGVVKRNREKKIKKKKTENVAAQKDTSSFRLFLISRPNFNRMPACLISRCTKIVVDEPVGLKARLGRAVESLDSTEFDALDQTSRSLAFAVCYTHCAMLERRRFGTLGFALPYDFTPRNLHYSIEMLRFMVRDGSEGISWDHLRYVCGNVVYGGHMIDSRDVNVCEAYMRYFVNEQCIDEPEMFPFLDPKPGQNAIHFKAPSPSSYSSYVRAVQRISTDNTPTAFGLHANCDLSVAEKAGRQVMNNTKHFLLFSSFSSSSVQEEKDPLHEEHRAESVILDILDACKSESLRNFNIQHLARLSGLVQFGDEEEKEEDVMKQRRRKKKKSEEEKKRNAKLKCARNAELKFAHVFLQECVRANLLLDNMRSSLLNVELTRKGERDTDAIVESTFNSICLGRVPDMWTALAYPSERSLMSWFSNMIKRVESLRVIAGNKLQLPLCTWLPGLFNPRTFLYATKCAFVAKSGSTKSIDVDTVSIETSVLNLQYEDVLKPARKGVYVYGLSLEGARWDMISNTLEASRPKVMFSKMPVVNMKVVLARPKEKYAMFRCPLYQTKARGPETHLLDIDVRTKLNRDKWTLAGVALLLDVGDDSTATL